MSKPPENFVFEVHRNIATGAYQVSPSADTLGYLTTINTKDEPTRLTIPDEINQGWQWAPWGANDTLPTVIREKVEKVPMAGQALYRLMGMMYGNGLAYYRNEELADGPNVSRAYLPEVEAWLKRNRINHEWLLPQFLNYRYTVSTFSELVFNRRKDYVTGLFHKEAEFCRKSRQNPNSLRSEYLLYSADFAGQFHGSLRNGQAIPLYDWMQGPEWIDRMAGYKMAWHSYLPTYGMIYYPTPPWIGLYKDKGWMDVSAGVSEIVDSLQRNQMKLVYQILIPVSYYPSRYPDWNNLDAQKKRDLMDETSTYLENELTDTQNAGKSITTHYDTDRAGNPMGKIEIVAIDDKLKRDSWVPSSNAADAQISQGLGLHPSQLGLAPEGGKMGAGSGSDQREAWNSQINLNTLEQDIILAPLNWISEFNGWGVTFFIDHTTHTTTNNQEDGQQPSATTITPA